ncbi:XRE family transcriptional regulator [Paenibacillus polymyxa]|nr:helix-turn-helix transcriptional regulator [Paenibacillus polymyxa]OBA07873.1 XRE family transcriptional regulator [Paenibacillus polymyxa]
MLISVKAARVEAGLKQKEVANILGLSLTGYNRKENGHAKFYVDEIMLLSELTKTPLENFFEVRCRKKTQ